MKRPTDPDEIRCTLLLEQALTHPTVLMRRAVIQTAGLTYNPDFMRGQDYELWLRAADHTRLANLPEILLLYRMHNQQLTRRAYKEWYTLMWPLAVTYFGRLGIKPAPAEYELFLALRSGQVNYTRDLLLRIEAWFYRLLMANQRACVYPEPVFAHILAQRWALHCYKMRQAGLWAVRVYWQSPLYRREAMNWQQELLFILKSVRKSFVQPA